MRLYIEDDDTLQEVWDAVEDKDATFGVDPELGMVFVEVSDEE